jgi:hypothetical protein
MSGNMLGAEELPEVLMAPCLDVLRVLSASERDLIRLVVETVTELRDNIIGDDDELTVSEILLILLLPISHRLLLRLNKRTPTKASMMQLLPNRRGYQLKT